MQAKTPAMADFRPALFLDRDGVINVDKGYVSRIEDFEWVEGAVETIAAFNRRGWYVFVVTNQSGIARGLIRAVDYERVRQRLDEMLARSGIALDGVYVCPHHPAITGPCDCRKPGLALYQQAAAEHDIDLARSVFIGDKPGDVEPASSLGGRAILVRTGYGRTSESAVDADVAVADDFARAVAMVLAGRASGAGP